MSFTGACSFIFKASASYLTDGCKSVSILSSNSPENLVTHKDEKGLTGVGV